MLRNDPSLVEGHLALGDLYARQGLQAEAKQTFGAVFDEYVKRNRMREAGDVLRRLAEVDPADMKVRIKLAELLRARRATRRRRPASTSRSPTS